MRKSLYILCTACAVYSTSVYAAISPNMAMVAPTPTIASTSSVSAVSPVTTSATVVTAPTTDIARMFCNTSISTSTCPTDNLTLVRSNDDRYFAYVVKKNGKDVVVLNGKEIGMYEKVVQYSMYFNTNNELIYQLEKDGKYAYSIAGIETPYYVQIYSPSYTYDMSKMAYAVQLTTDTYGWVYNGKMMSGTYTSMPSISAYEKYIVTSIYTNGGGMMYTNSSDTTKTGATIYDYFYIDDVRMGDGTAQSTYHGTYTNGRTTYMYYSIAKKGMVSLVRSVNGKATTLETFAYPIENLNISYSGKNYSYSVQNEDNTYSIYVNGVKWTYTYDYINNMYWGGKNGNVLYKSVTRDGKSYFSIGAKGYGPYDTMEYMNYSGDNSHWNIYVSRSGKQYLVVDGKEIELKK